MAAIVSGLGVVGGFSATLDHPRNLPLLGNGENVVDHPVQHQAGREEKEHEAENKRHEHGDLRLNRIRRRRIKLGLDQHGDHHDDGQNIIWVLRRQILDPQHPRRTTHLDGTEQRPIQGNKPPSGLIFSVL